MKIVQVSQRIWPAVGGVESSVYYLAKMLVNKGYKVVIFSSDLITDNIRLDNINSPTNEIKIKRFRSIKLLRSIDASSLMPSMFTGLLSEKSIDIIHSHGYGYFPSYICALVGKLRNIPVVLSTVLAPETTVHNYLRKFTDYTIGKFSLKNSTHIIASTSFEKDYLQSLGALPSKISIIPYFVERSRFKKTSPEKFRREWGINGEMILFVGRIAKNKGLNYLIKSMPFILKKYPNAKLVLAGKDWGVKKELFFLAKKIKIEFSVIFTEYLIEKDLVNAYAACDVFVLPSTAGETFGIVLLEAMAAGKPIVASKIGGIPEVVKDKINGFLVKPAQEKNLTDAIMKVLGNKDKSKKMSQANLINVKEYSLENFVTKIENIYKTLRYFKK